MPEGFCIATEAYKRIIENNKDVNALVEELLLLKIEDRENISETCRNIRKLIEESPIPKDIDGEIIAGEYRRENPTVGAI